MRATVTWPSGQYHAGIRWPHHSCRDTFQSRIVWPQLTTVRQPLQELGRTGVSLLMRLLEGQRVEALRMELSTTLVVRASTAPPRDAAS